jgi:hypothetical protein
MGLSCAEFSYTLMPMSQLFCEAVALSILGGDFECILDRVSLSLCSLGELDAHFLSADEFGVGLRLQVF